MYRHVVSAISIATGCAVSAQPVGSARRTLDCMIQPHQTVQVGSASPGVIDRILVDRGDIVARLHRAGTVLQEEYHDGQVDMTALVPPKLAGQVRKLANSGARKSEIRNPRLETNPRLHNSKDPNV